MRSMISRFAVLLALVIVVGALVGCGGSAATSGPSTIPSAAPSSTPQRVLLSKRPVNLAPGERGAVVDDSRLMGYGAGTIDVVLNQTSPAPYVMELYIVKDVTLWCRPEPGDCDPANTISKSVDQGVNPKSLTAPAGQINIFFRNVGQLPANGILEVGFTPAS